MKRALAILIAGAWTVTPAHATGWPVFDAAAFAELQALNTAVGGSFPDAVLGGKSPNSQTKGGAGAAMEVKYVAVFST